MSKRLGGNIGCKDDKKTSWHSIGSPDGSSIGQQFNIGEKSTVILCTYINGHVGSPKQMKNTR